MGQAGFRSRLGGCVSEEMGTDLFKASGRCVLYLFHVMYQAMLPKNGSCRHLSAAPRWSHVVGLKCGAAPEGGGLRMLEWYKGLICADSALLPDPVLIRGFSLVLVLGFTASRGCIGCWT